MAQESHLLINAITLIRSLSSAHCVIQIPAQLLSEDLRDRTFGQANLFAGLFLVLVIIDLATGTPFWAHWPGLALATFIGLKAAPLFVRGWLKVSYVRSIVMVGALAVVNLFTWVGYPWVLWPAAVLITVE